MNNNNYEIAYENAVRYLSDFTLNQRYHLVEQLNAAMLTNLIRVAQVFQDNINNDMIHMFFDMYIQGYDPDAVSIEMIMSKSSYPDTAPSIRLMPHASYLLNLQYYWINSIGVLGESIMETFNPNLNISQIQGFIEDLIKKFNLYLKVNLLNGDYFTPRIVDPLNYGPDNEHNPNFLGNGKYGTCFKSNYNNNPVCIKQIKKDKGDSRKYISREVEAMTLLNRGNNKGILQLYGIIEHKDNILLVTQLAPNGNLDKYMKNTTKDVRKDTTLFCDIFKQIASAVAFIHENHVYHRDIKPDNILMDENDNPVLGDFGLSRVVNETVAPNDITHCGTYPFAAPELFIDHNVITDKCDIYSLGLVGYYIMTKCDLAKKLFGDEAKCRTNKTNPSYEVQINSFLNPILYNLFQKCLSFNPEERPSAAEVVKELDEYNGPLYKNSID
ncbi:hypothetical protein WA158_003950 [Blastocystis sp. Blastoise]